MEDDFFQKKEIKKLRSIAGGDTYVIIYLKIILLSLKNGGKLYFEGIDDTFIAEIALEIDENKDNVGITLEFLMKHSAVIQTEENEFKVNDIVKSIGSETAVAIRVRKHREKFKLLPCNKDVTPLKQNDNGESESEINIEIDKEAYRITELFFNDLMTIINPTRYNKNKPDLQEWSEHIRLLHERDGVEYKDMVPVWQWAFNDKFWKANILSTDKFRKQFDKLKIQMNENKINKKQTESQYQTL